MEIFPAETVTTITTQLTTVLADNVLVIIGVTALAVGISFVVRWFNKSTKRIKA